METVRDILEALELRGWTLAAIADELGTHRETVSRWKGGSQRPLVERPILAMLEGLLKRKRVPKKRRYH